jgi:preprotein translocase subunit SecE
MARSRRRRRQTGGQAPRAESLSPVAESALPSAVPVPEPGAPAPSVSASTPAPTQTVRPRRTGPRPTTQTASGRGGQRGRLYRWTHPRFLVDTIAELRKVVWPSRAETRSLTTVVVVIAIAVGVLLGSVDWIFNRLMENVLLS